jgi:hypothetical protein
MRSNRPGLMKAFHFLTSSSQPVDSAALGSPKLAAACDAAPRRLLEPCLESDPGVRCQWSASLLPTFANTSHMGAGAEMDGVPVQADQLGEAQSGLGREQQQGVIAASEPCRPIGCSKDRLDLGSRQEIHLPLVVALARYRKHALDMGAVGRLLEGHETKERADGAQALAARPNASAALRLEIGQERPSEGRIQIFEC